MTLNTYEFSFNGLVMNGTNAYGVIAIDGLSPPDRREESIDKAEDHGAYVYAAFLSPRRIVIEGDIVGLVGDDFEADVTAWRRAFVPQVSPLPFTYLLPGDGDITKQIFCVPTRSALAVDSEYPLGYAKWHVELLAGDPRIYDMGSTITQGAGTANGLGFNIQFNVNFGGGSSSAASAGYNNIGIFPTPATAKLHGPMTNPEIRNNTVGKSIKMNIDIATGDALWVDFASKTLKMNGTVSKYGTLSSDSEWWQLEPGVNDIALTVDAGTGQMELFYRSAWI